MHQDHFKVPEDTTNDQRKANHFEQKNFGLYCVLFDHHHWPTPNVFAPDRPLEIL